MSDHHKSFQSVPRILLAQVISPHTHRDDALSDMKETEILVNSYGGEVVYKTVQHRFKPDPALYLGRGKIDNLAQIVSSIKIDIIVFDDMLDPGTLHRIEKIFWQVNPQILVWDRVDLILEIFEKQAQSTEASLQIQLAKLDQMGPRIYGLGGKLLSRQRGGIGLRGVGETNIQIMRQHLKKSRQRLEKDLKKAIGNREKMIERRKQSGALLVSLVGYTNSGKTTLFNHLTGKAKSTQNSLFTTLDTVTGRLRLNTNGRTVLISDTIGFIRDLPPNLIDTFRSTLMEVVNADVILHVVDISDNQIMQKIDVVESILSDLSINPSKVKLVLNKSDLISKQKREKISQNLAHMEPILISAKNGDNIEKIIMDLYDGQTTQLTSNFA